MRNVTKFFACCLISHSFFVQVALAQPRKAAVIKRADNAWELQVDQKPYVVRGVVYNFGVVGDAPDKKALRDLYERYGIMVVVGHFFGEWTIGSGAQWEKGTDYTDPKQRKNLLECVRVMVEEHKNEPYTLMWMLGNENFNPYDQDNAEKEVEAFLTLVNEAARLIHSLDPDHPVALCNWGAAHVEEISRFCPGEGNSIGGLAFIWCDMRSLAGNAFSHDAGPAMGMKAVEWYGLSSQGDGSHSPFLRQLRKAYFMYQGLWGGS